jgi:hypothetical protein
MNGFHCATCGEYHPELPMVLGASAPFAWEQLPANERPLRGELSSDQCWIDGSEFYVRGRLEIPVLGSQEPFTWLVWVGLSRESFTRADELWFEVGRESEPSYPASLQSALPYSPGTLNLAVRLHTRAVGQRPFVEVEPQAHLLYEQQRHGVTLGQVQAIVENALHAT